MYLIILFSYGSIKKNYKKGWALTNFCWYETKDGFPMVGSTFCDTYCPHYKGTIRLLFWKFVKCGYERI
jgi:hypothetical protein